MLAAVAAAAAAAGVAFPLPEAGRVDVGSCFIGGGEEDAAAPSADLPSTSIWRKESRFM